MYQVPLTRWSLGEKILSKWKVLAPALEWPKGLMKVKKITNPHRALNYFYLFMGSYYYSDP